MENWERSSLRGDVATGRDVNGTRLTVEWYFGDLVANVAASAPVSEGQLLMSLTRVEEEIREQYTELTSEGENIATAGAPGEVLGLSSAAWESLIGDCGLSDDEAAAVGDVHTGMADAIADPFDDSTPLVRAARPDDLE